MFTAQDSTEIRRPVATVFALLDDFARMPTWLESCTLLEAKPPAARAAGTPLRYRYAMGGDSGEMSGTIIAYAPEHELAMRFEDPRFETEVRFRVEPTEYGTRLYHAIGVEHRAPMPRYMEAMMQAGNRKQVGSNLTRLKRLVESTSEPPAIP